MAAARAWAWGCALAAGLASALALSAPRRWPFELVTHFPYQIALASAVLGVACLAARLPLPAAAALAIAFANALTVAAPGLDAAALRMPEIKARAQTSASDLPLPGPAVPDDARDWVARVAVFNVEWANHEHAPAESWLRARAPDIVVALESNAGWRRTFARLRDLYPHQAVVAETPAGAGVAVLSRHPLDDVEVLRPGPDPVKPAIQARVAGPRPFALLAVHPWSPRSAERTRARDRYLARIAERAATIEGPLAVAGDFNATPWSPVMRDFLSRTRTSVGDPTPTWPAAFGRFGVPIDHVAVRGADLLRRASGPALGSDHLPILVEIRIP